MNRLRAAIGGMPRSFWLLWSGMLVTRAGNFVLPFLALYLTQGLHLSLQQAGLAIGLYGAGNTLANLVGGYLADHIGRRTTLVLALGLGGLCMMALGFAHRLALLLPGMFVVALVTEMYRPAMQAAVVDLVPPGDRVRAFGLVYWVINVGFAIGVSIGGLLAQRSFLWLFLGDGATTLVFALIIALGVPETRPARAHDAAHAPRERGGWSALLLPYRNRRFVAFLVLTFLFCLVFFQSATTLAVDMVRHGVRKSSYGAALALNGVVIVVVQPFLGPFLARRKRARVMAVGAALVGLGFGLNAIVHSAPLYALAVLVWTIGELGVLPVGNAMVADLAPLEVRGRFQGAYGSAFGLAVCVAPGFGMTLLERVGSRGLWLVCLGIGAVVTLGHLALGRAMARAIPAPLAESTAS